MSLGVVRYDYVKCLGKQSNIMLHANVSPYIVVHKSSKQSVTMELAAGT